MTTENTFSLPFELFNGSDGDLSNLAVQIGNMVRVDHTDPRPGDKNNWLSDKALQDTERALMRQDLPRYAELMLRTGTIAEISFGENPLDTNLKMGGVMILVQHVNALRRIQGDDFDPAGCKCKLTKLWSFCHNVVGPRAARAREMVAYNRAELARRTGDYKTMAKLHGEAAATARNRGDKEGALIAELKQRVALVNETIVTNSDFQIAELLNMLTFCRKEALDIEDPAWQFHRITHMFLATFWTGHVLEDARDLKQALRELEAKHTEIAKQQRQWVLLIYAIYCRWHNETVELALEHTVAVTVMEEATPEAKATAILLNLVLASDNTEEVIEACGAILSDKIQGAHQVKAIAERLREHASK